MITYKELKKKLVDLKVTVQEMDNPRRLEAAGIGLIDLSQIAYYGPIGLFEIYEGTWGSLGKITIEQIVPHTNVDVYGKFLRLVTKKLKRNK